MDRNIPIKPKVFVIIPNKDGLCHLRYSLPSLMSTNYENYHCVLIDNHSCDDSISFVRDNHKTVQVLENKHKKGFASTVNIGIKHALEQNADYIAVYNSDIKVLSQWISAVLEIFSTQRNIGLIGYTEISKDNILSWDPETEVSFREVKRLSGCLYICPSQVFKDIGLLDEDYFMYGEDNDLFLRLSKAGNIIIQTNLPVWHYGAGASPGGSFKITWLTYRNAIRCSLKNESVFGVLRMILSLLNQGCNPFLREDPSDAFSKRIRRYNPFVNFFLVLMSCGWNILNIIPTIQARYNSMQRIKKVKLDQYFN